MNPTSRRKAMDLGAFSVSLSVKDIEASREFYEKLGFEPIGGKIDDNWLILRNGDHVIGLFQGMFDKNMLTFNPGWNQQCKETDSFTDVREIQRMLKEQGVELYGEADETSKGPASITLFDPDGNPILIDQHR
jgi:catechol 2,3-dioxygenase-like lactoylglutathione lyase family enzyme